MGVICYMHTAYETRFRNIGCDPSRERPPVGPQAPGFGCSPDALAKQMRLSPFEVHAAVQRLIAARLVTKHAGPIRPIMAALRAFVISGAPYAYPPVRGETTIGFPTSHAVPPLSEQIQPSADLPPVWPHPEGTTRGQGVLPLYENLPLAAVDDPKLYELLALFDALRIGQARERELAKKLLEQRLQ